MVSFVLTGPESTGKSILAEELTKHFEGCLVNEYAREYIEKLTLSYSFSDVEIIARQQIADYNRVRHHSDKDQLVFFDTFLIITKIWFEEVFYCCPLWIDRAIRIYKVDYALLCVPDLPWKADGVRENPHIRQYLFDRYLNALEYYQIPYGIVEGEGEKRLMNAIKVIENHYSLAVLNE
jgi:nicotinamide riboside kinase